MSNYTCCCTKLQQNKVTRGSGQRKVHRIVIGLIAAADDEDDSVKLLTTTYKSSTIGV